MNSQQSRLWLCHLHSLHRLPFSLNILREVCAYLCTQLFPCICDCFLRLYNPDTQLITKFPLDVNLVGSTFISLDTNNVLCLGRRPASTGVYDLILTSLQLVVLPGLSTPREAPGAVSCWKTGCVYAFGGYGHPNDLASSEKYSLSDKRWEELGAMQEPRSYFTPCHYRALIYLVGYAAAVETFNPTTEAFALLPLTLPLQLSDTRSVAFVNHGDLYLLTSTKQAGVWKVDSEGEFRRWRTGETCWSTHQPLVVGSVVLIAWAGKVLKFSLESNSFV